ncbi:MULTISPECIES: FadR/GntR family transcriptional regulator [unclassified Ensifer]|uniref:FadR/GntR family transcriptional regulator n=1 Tax=unclassified Ensifer TaxID=2633371 RepID=UPI000813A47C|nr:MULTISPECIES: FadR/GntR family transcriptional regulator [unclassified Ensifer]OCP05677.1 GntR family transcriptional regulator [Ensifer sp. LC11]OCP06419.1 GntR family transcriptional regulator [Ensifer sp. LC13]OCP06855.1 GntR family transcriptional regulator [Ensifer sp. LC14]OCP31342.1 GntR family transcriptional regulator [Ensifer sp. LC499]
MWPSLQTPRKRTSHRLVVEELGQAVIGGEFAVGDILPGDTELAARFNVSRTVLREAMKTLAAKGLVVARARIGTRVMSRANWNLFDGDVLTWHFRAGVDEQFLRHVSEVRLALEPYAAGLAARRATDADISHMMRLAVAMGDAGHSAQTLARADLEFHLRLLEASLNPFMQTVGSLIEAALIGVFQLTNAAADGAEIDRVAVAHIRIVEEIRLRNEEGARIAMEHVIRVGQQQLIANLKGSG